MDQFSRVESLIGKENLKKIKTKTVLVIGLGGVGGVCTTTLVRSGIENIVIVDYDKVDVTNINRQVTAFHKTIDQYKVNVLDKMLKEINPNCNIIKIRKKIDESNILELFNNKIDYIVDACDTVETKKLLIKKSIELNIPLISCMGTAKKLDPTKLKITDIRKTNYDKLAKILRLWIKKEQIKAKIMVVSSEEEIIKTENNILGSMSFVPNVAGIMCAEYIIDQIIKERKK